MNPCGASTSGFRDHRLSPGLATPAFKSLIKGFFIWVSIQVEITVKLSRNSEIRKIKINKESIVEHVLKKIDIKPDTVIVMSKGKPVPIDDKIFNMWKSELQKELPSFWASMMNL